MDAPVTLLVSLWAVDGGDAALSSYEDAVLALLEHHGGTVVVRVRRAGDDFALEDDGGVGGPLETHVLTFPDEDALDAYLADPRRVALSELRQRAIARTEVTRVDRL